MSLLSQILGGGAMVQELLRSKLVLAASNFSVFKSWLIVQGFCRRI
jgi:hypothetical protein